MEVIIQRKIFKYDLINIEEFFCKSTQFNFFILLNHNLIVLSECKIDN